MPSVSQFCSQDTDREDGYASDSSDTDSKISKRFANLYERANHFLSTHSEDEEYVQQPPTEFDADKDSILRFLSEGCGCHRGCHTHLKAMLINIMN